MDDLELTSALLKELFPICRSLTGNGVRQTLKILSQVVPLNIHEVPSGKKVFDWTVPPEWNIQDAWIKNSKGEKIVDFNKSNIHVVGYSRPLHQKISFAELKENLHSLPEQPDAIPYRTSYFKENWGFCVSHKDLQKFDEKNQYEVFIDSELNLNGSLTYADAVHKGISSKEIILSTYCCHPSLVNDNLSGVVTAVLLFKYISQHPTYYTYRLIVAPETLGVIAYLHENREAFKQVLGGAVITCTAGQGPLGLKPTFKGDHWLDKIARRALNEATETSSDWVEYPFVPDGSDERQYASPGFRIPTVTICKDKYYEFKEYHTSLDNLDFATPENLVKTLQVYQNWFEQVDMVRTYERLEPHCEFQLGKRGLYPNIGGSYNQGEKKEKSHREYAVDSEIVTGKDLEAISWLMFGCDGKTDLLNLSERSKQSLPLLHRCAQKMLKKELLRVVDV